VRTFPGVGHTEQGYDGQGRPGRSIRRWYRVLNDREKDEAKAEEDVDGPAEPDTNSQSIAQQAGPTSTACAFKVKVVLTRAWRQRETSTSTRSRALRLAGKDRPRHAARHLPLVDGRAARLQEVRVDSCSRTTLLQKALLWRGAPP